MNRQLPGPSGRVVTALACGALAVLAWDVSTSAQDRLKTMPGYAQYQKMSAQLGGAVRSGRCQRHMERRQLRLRLRVRRQALPLRRRIAQRHRNWSRDGRSAGRARRAGRRTRRHRHRAWPAGGIGRCSRRQAQGLLPRSQPVGRRHQRRQRIGDYQRRQRQGPHQVRHGQLGLRRGARPDERYLVVAGQPQGRLLSLRREAGARLQPAARPDQDSKRQRRRGLSQGRRRESDRRPLRVRRCHEEEHARRRSRRQALRRHRRRTLCLSRVVVAGRHRALVQPHQPAAERPRARRRQPRHRRDARDHPRGMADGLDREPSADAVPQRQPPLHLGVGAKRLCQPLSLRPLREAHHAADGAHVLRSLGDRESGRSRGRDLLHGARRRQPHEGAAAPCRHRRQG